MPVFFRNGDGLGRDGIAIMVGFGIIMPFATIALFIAVFILMKKAFERKG